MDVTELMDIVEEEESIIDPEEDHGTLTKNALGRVLEKLRTGDYDFTSTEKAAIRYALKDVGELYLHAGTPEGFDADCVGDVEEARSNARKALEQARQLGIIP